MFFWITVFCMSYTFIRFLKLISFLIEVNEILIDPTDNKLEEFKGKYSTILVKKFKVIEDSQKEYREELNKKK